MANKGTYMTDHQLLGILVALGISVNVILWVLTRRVLLMTYTLDAKSDTLIQAVIELLKRTR